MDELAGLKSGEEHGVTWRRTWSYRDNQFLSCLYSQPWKMIEKGRDGDPQWLADGWVLKPLMSCRTLGDAEFYGLLTWETDENHAD